MNFIVFIFKFSKHFPFWLILCFPCFLHAQNNPLIFERFTTEEGLPNTAILDIVQGHEGYIWLATDDGLVRYDGYKFVTYRSIPGDSTSLSQNRIEKLYVDFTGDIWLGSKSGIDRYNPDCDCFIRYSSHESAPSNQQAGQINAFAEDRDNNLWIGTQEGGLFRYELESDKFTRFLDNPNNPNNLLEDEVRVLLVDKNNDLWIGTGEPFDATISGGGLIRLDLQTGNTKRFLHDPANPNSLIDNRVSALTEDRDGKLWVGTCQSGLHYYDAQKEEFVRMMPAHNALYAPQGEMGLWSSCPHVRFIHQDKDGEFWVGTYNGGIHHFDPESKKLSHYAHNPADPESLNSNQVWTFLQDRQDRVWIGNLPGGLHMVDPSLHKFKVYTHDVENPTSLSFDHVMGIYEAPQELEVIWLGTQGGGLNRLNTETGQFQHFRHHPNKKHSISSDIVWTTYEDQNGTFWVGTEAGLDTLDRQTGKFTPYEIFENNAYTAISYPVIYMHEDRQGYLWLGTWSGGIIRLSKDKKTIKRYQFSNSSQQTFYNSVFAIHEDAKGTIWVGIFQNGLFEYDANDDTFIHHLGEFGVNCLAEDSTGRFWVGTGEGGILHYNPANDIYKQYTTVDGLPSDAIHGALIDDKWNIWLSTENGIARFEPASNRFTSYDTSDGLTSTNFNYTSAFKSKDGQLFFGSAGGLVAFYPNQIQGNPYPPDVVLDGLQIAGKAYDLQSYEENPSLQITLSHQQNDLTFDYVGLHFTNPSDNIYKYQMLPYDEDWINAGTQRTARYTNLDPGEYTFQVTARSSDGLWNKDGAALHFYIAPPWWTRWWAYALFIAILIGIGYWFYRFQLSRKLAVAENKRLTEIDHLKSSLYTNITHEFRTPLTVILGMTNDLQANIRNKQLDKAATSLEMIQRNGKKLLHLVHEMLDLAKLESGNMELQWVQGDVVPFVKYLGESFQSLAQASQIDLTVYAEVDALVMDFDADKLSAVISNLLSNAIKFTAPGGKIIMHLNRTLEGENEYFVLKVKDNGSGISEEAIPKIFDRFYQVDSSSSRKGEGTGIGLALTKEFLTLMQGTIDVKSAPGRGSEFTVRIPVSRNVPEAKAAGIPLSYQPHPSTANNSPKTFELPDNDEDLPLAVVIEDNTDVARYLQTCLQGKYLTLHAINGLVGIEMAFEKVPDVIICDVMMPGKDGFEVCTTLKSDARTDHIPIIMLTAKATLKDRLTGLSHGADAYLEKPFVKAELFTRLDQLVLLRKKIIDKFENDGFTQFLKNRPENPKAKFLKNVVEVIHKEMNNENFGTRQLAYSLHLSESQLYRKLKAITGKSTAIFIRSIRLQKAKELILTTDKTISEIAYEVGFHDPSWFSRAFKEEFGFAPSETVK